MKQLWTLFFLPDVPDSLNKANKTTKILGIFSTTAHRKGRQYINKTYCHLSQLDRNEASSTNPSQSKNIMFSSINSQITDRAATVTFIVS